ncbi:MAG: glycosyltransferase [Cyanobacteria bacterium J06638_22]
MSINIAYLINQYPKVSHSFIRREILALEEQGLKVQRFALRSCDAELVDEADKHELSRTRYILSVGLPGLLIALLKTAIAAPTSFLKALALAINVGWMSERGLIFHLIYLAEACVLLSWLRKGGVSHVHSHFGTNATTVAMLCHALGGPPYSFTVHGPEEFDKVKAIGLPEKLKHAKFAIAISSFGKSQLFRWCAPSEWNKIHIVHCGLDQSFFARSTAAIPHQSGLVCIGRLSEQKGHFLLLEAINRLHQKGINVPITFVGDGELRPKIEAFIQQFDLQDIVHITGWATNAEVQQYLLNSRGMVLPSFAEGLPVVIMEAFALRRPVISTYIAGIPELVKPRISGWLVPSGSVNDLEAAMQDLIHTSPQELETMGEQGYTDVFENHNIATEAEKLADLFSKYADLMA